MRLHIVQITIIISLYKYLFFPGDGENGNSVAVSIDLNGITYEGVLFAQNDSNATSPASTTANSNTKTSRST